jgi:hypothetical protein
VLDPATGEGAIVWAVPAEGRPKVLFQRFTANDQVVGEPIAISTGSARTHRAAIGYASALGKYLVSWPDDGDTGPTIWSKWVSKDGEPLDEAVRLSPRPGQADEPFVSCLDAGCLTAWWDRRIDQSDVFGTWRSATSTEQDGPLVRHDGAQRLTGMAIIPSKETAVFTWPDPETGQIGLALATMPHRIPAAVHWLQAEATGSAIGYPRVAVDPTQPVGCVAWSSATGITPQIKAQRFDLSGQPIGAVITIAQKEKIDRVQSVFPLGNGQFLLVWKRFRYEPAAQGVRTVWDQISAQRILADGTIGEPNTAALEVEQPAILFDEPRHALVLAGIDPVRGKARIQRIVVPKAAD